MEDAHRKAVRASSLIQKVISKKLMFEQERSMERGELREETRACSRSESVTRTETPSDLAEDEHAVVPVPVPVQRSLPPVAFRCRGGGDEPGSLRSAHDEGAHGGAAAGKPTKMSRLFVPSIRAPGLNSEHASACKPPEIKINLRSVRERGGAQPLGVSRLRALGPGPGSGGAHRADPADKVPHFTVRDFRDTKTKLHAPIHQVRDVRKLVKSSYHFVSMETDGAAVDGLSEHRKSAPRGNPASGSPIVIKCQSVNTNSHGKRAPEVSSLSPEVDLSLPEGATKAAAPQKVAEEEARRSEEMALMVRRSVKAVDRKPESKMAALEKLQAAVKTMEQLYVFEKNEWRRKDEPLPLAGSHVMSLLASEEVGAELPEREGGGRPEVRVSVSARAPRATAAPGGTSAAPKPASSAKAVESRPGEEPREAKPTARRFSGDGENYLTIPVKPPPDRTSTISFSGRPRADPPPAPGARCSPDPPPATIYHSLPPQQLFFSPAVTPAPPPEPLLHATQRKMLLDPTTGSYYLVDTPVQPATRRLFDPETGQYVDVPLPPAPAPPVPLPLPSMAAFGHAYMIYPGFVPPPAVLPARALALVPPDGGGGDAAVPSQAEALYMDTPFYLTTAATPHHVTRVAPTTKPPVISITSQQGPRIVAPPSFDGTTMSFVVEHR